MTSFLRIAATFVFIMVPAFSFPTSLAQTTLSGVTSKELASDFFMTFPPCQVMVQSYGSNGRPLGPATPVKIGYGFGMVSDKVLSDLLNNYTKYLIGLNQQAPNLGPYDFINALLRRENDIRGNVWNNDQNQHRGCYESLVREYRERSNLAAGGGLVGKNLYEVYILPPFDGVGGEAPKNETLVIKDPAMSRQSYGQAQPDGLGARVTTPSSENRYSGWKNVDINVGGIESVYDVDINIEGLAANAIVASPELGVLESTPEGVRFHAEYLSPGRHSAKINFAGFVPDPVVTVWVSGFLENSTRVKKEFSLPVNLKLETPTRGGQVFAKPVPQPYAGPPPLPEEPTPPTAREGFVTGSGFEVPGGPTVPPNVAPSRVPAAIEGGREILVNPTPIDRVVDFIRSFF